MNKIVNERYVTPECARLLRDKGFTGECRSYYKVFPAEGIAAIYHSSEVRPISEDDPNELQCPTISMVIDWLRLSHNLFVTCEIDFSDGAYPMYDSVVYNLATCEKHSVTGYDRYDYDKSIQSAVDYCLKEII
jgi:hypothetical protein